MQLKDLPTPCLVLDKGILERNLRRMSDAVHRHGVALRPHLKTAKSAAVARLATTDEKGGITVSTLAEAEYFAESGFRDILLANALPPQKLSRAEVLAFLGVAVTLVTDNVAMASAISAHPGRFKALVEIDSGDRRTGVSADGDDLIEVARALGDKLAGVMDWPDQKDEKLKDVKLKDGELTFSAVRVLGDNKIPVDYTFKIDGDKLKGKGSVENGGQKTEFDIEGKREKADK